MKRKLVLSIFLSLSAQAFTCPLGQGTNARGIKAIAVELIRNEMSGARVQGMGDHDCLKQEKYKFIKPQFFPSNEFLAEIEYIVPKKDVELLDVRIVDKVINKYEANYTFKALEDSKEVTVSDQLTFIRNTTTKNILMYGCAFTTIEPNHISIFKECSLEK